MPDDDDTHCCSATLIILGDHLDPEEVTARLGLRPDRIWRKGEHKSFKRPDGSTLTFDSVNEYSGWKLFVSESLHRASLPDQLQYWLKFIDAREATLRSLHDNGAEIVLDLFIATSEVADLSPGELAKLSRCGVGLEWTFSPGD